MAGLTQIDFGMMSAGRLLTHGSGDEEYQDILASSDGFSNKEMISSKGFAPDRKAHSKATSSFHQAGKLSNPFKQQDRKVAMGVKAKQNKMKLQFDPRVLAHMVHLYQQENMLKAPLFTGSQQKVHAISG